MKPWVLLFLAGLLILSTQLATAKTTKQLCPPKVKPGECPKVKIDPDHPCNQDCACDSECEGNKKCCPVGCARECFSPGPL
ncbi:waprin-Phi3-like isoform X1 [Pseudonaja textilis]|uniref:waprin-Phi3-like isoform X1 n=1 Tax=Pseudonaja textilis TaxID=8673 RepID=UPI000EAA606F|nr:waprin-Phi3-like isoform X1 [Pseudonaja textilis]